MKYRAKSIYICHPYSNPMHNIIVVRQICREIVKRCEGLPLAPHLLFPPFLDDEEERDLAMSLCLCLLGKCDEVRVYGEVITKGMQDEITEAKMLAIPCTYHCLPGAGRT
jgi:hypothetical protein